MTTISPTSGAGYGMARSAPSAPQASAAAAIDPIKLLKKHTKALIIGPTIGAALGVGAFFLLQRFAPQYRSFVQFECRSPITEIGEAPSATGGKSSDMELFVATQVARIKSDTVLRRVAEDPRLEREAPRWAKQFKKSGGIDKVDVLENLADNVGVKPIQGTSLIDVGFSWRERADATGIVRLVKENYLQVLETSTDASQLSMKNALQGQITALKNDIERLQASRNGLIGDQDLNSLSERSGELVSRLNLVNSEQIKLRTEAVAQRQLYLVEKAKLDAAVIDYSAELRDAVENDRFVMQLKSQIAQLEAEKKGQIERGFSEEHRAIKDLTGRIQGADQNLQAERDKLLRQRFDSQLAALDRQIGQFDAQDAKLQTERETLQRQLTEVTKTVTKVADMTKEIDRAGASRNELEDKMKNIVGLGGLDSASRVVVAQAEILPDRMSFPKLVMFLPAGFFLGLALVGGTVLARELLDQRVKGPSDIALIPRARVAGWIPDASEDPSGTGAVETAFRDRARGVVAESYRQARASLSKRLHQSGHKTLLVVAGMPGSGATTVVSNLAFAFASTDQRVLVIDANFRRPGMHRVFGLPEGPGLADVLGQPKPLSAAVQKTVDPKLDVLTVGSKEQRVLERLSGDAMGKLLAEARASYDLVLIDSAPALISGDGVALANRCDASILVVKALAEKRGMVARLRNELDETRGEFLGILVNGVRSSAGGYLRSNIRAAHEYHTEAA